jgi:hypothetical protein
MAAYRERLTEVYRDDKTGNRVLANIVRCADNSFNYRLYIEVGGKLLADSITINPLNLKEAERVKKYVQLLPTAKLAIEDTLERANLSEVYTASVPGFQKSGEAFALYAGSKMLTMPGEELPRDPEANLPGSAGEAATAGDKINDYMRNRPIRQLVCLWALSAILCALLGKNFLLALVGTSSTGKTSAMEVALSMFSAPSYRKAKRTWASTQNAIIKALDNWYGFPVVLDDTQLATRIKHFQSVIYELYDGSSIARLGAKQQLTAPCYFNTSFGITAERSLLETCKDEGVLPRLLEIGVSGRDLFDSAGHANDMQSFIRENYGTLFVDFLIKACNSDLEAAWKAEINRLRGKYPQPATTAGSILSRCMETVALVTVTADIAKRALPLEFNTLAVERQMIRSFKTQIAAFFSRQPTPANILKAFKPYMPAIGRYSYIPNAEMNEFHRECRVQFGIGPKEVNEILEKRKALERVNGVFSNPYTANGIGGRGYKVWGVAVNG